MDETRRKESAKPPASLENKTVQKTAEIKANPDATDPQNTAVPVAVALKDHQAGSAPTIVASGRGFIAEQILELAFANGVKVREDADLVQILAALDVESEIPIEALAAVTEILNYVYAANRGETVKEPVPDDEDAN